jgi:hypothetical protein
MVTIDFGLRNSTGTELLMMIARQPCMRTFSRFGFFNGDIVNSGVFFGVNASSQVDVDTLYNADFPDGRSFGPMKTLFAYRRVLHGSFEFSSLRFSRALLACRTRNAATLA